MIINLVDFVVRHAATGAIDQDATLLRLGGAVAEWDQAETLKNGSIAVTIDEIFDAQKVPQPIATPLLAAMVLTRKGLEQGEFGRIKDEVASFVRTSPRFDSSAGRKGGVRRLARAENAREHGITAEASEPNLEAMGPEAAGTDSVDVEVHAS